MDDNKNIDFVARHYRKGSFDSHAGWKRLGVAPVVWWKRYRTAAAVAATVVLSATAAIIYHEHRISEASQQEIESVTTDILTEVKVIDFENASLTDIVGRIEQVYGVKVENLPDDGEEYNLSLHYEGTPTDLIAVINELLGTQMTVTEK